MANILTKALNAIGFRNMGATSPDSVNPMVAQQIETYLSNNYAVINSVVPVAPGATDQQAVKAYAGNWAVYTIVKKKIQMAANIPFYEYAIKDQKAFRKYKQLTSGDQHTAESLYKAGLYKVKAMEQVSDSSPINQLLLNPNSEDSQFEFLEKVYGFLNLNGETFMWRKRLSMGANKGKTVSLNTLPPAYMDVIPDGNLPVGVGGFIFNLYGAYPLRPDEVIQIKYFNPIHDNNNCQLRGLSPIKAGYKLLIKDESAIDGEISSFKNGGPPLIVYREDARDLTDTQAGLLKQRFVNETSGVQNINKIMLSAGKLGAIQTGISPVDQELLESGKFTFQQLCALWQMQPGFYLPFDATYNNADAYKKAAYTDSIIPDVIRVRDGFNKAFRSEMSGTSFIDADLTNIPVLQQDMKTLSEWLAISPEITFNERREMKAQERMSDPNMDKVYVSSSLSSLDDLNIQPANIAPQSFDPLTNNQPA